VNSGQKILLRLRYPGDKNQFMPLEQVVDTMLHELCHNVISPHNAEFHALWDQLRKEQEALVSKGYTGEGFLSQGHQLGGRRVPRDEARRIARAAAEKRRTLGAGSGQRLGGAPVRAGTDIRQVIVNAIERRNTVLQGCGGSGKKNDKEIGELDAQATRNGFKTKAEEDKANEQAIAQALWELVQEDQKKEYGEDYIASTPANPTGNGGGEIGATKSLKREPPESPSRNPPPRTKPAPRNPPRHVSRLVAEAENKKSLQKPIPKTADEIIASSSVRIPAIPASAPASDPPSSTPYEAGWTCPRCTLHNPFNFLVCEVCDLERPIESTKKIAESEGGRKKVTTAQPVGLREDVWTCRCGNCMEGKWWTCNVCGRMKESS